MLALAKDKGFCPVDPRADRIEIAFADPGRLRLDALAGQCLAGLQHEALLPGHQGGDVLGDGDAVGVAEDLDPPAPVGRLRVAQPAQAFGVVTERRRVLQRVRDVEAGGAGRAWSKSIRPTGCSPRQTPFHGPKSPWQTISPGAQVPGLLDQRVPGGGW